MVPILVHLRLRSCWPESAPNRARAVFDGYKEERDLQPVGWIRSAQGHELDANGMLVYHLKFGVDFTKISISAHCAPSPVNHVTIGLHIAMESRYYRYR